VRRAVVNADDFGICPETNQAIELGFTHGILTSASLMPNMPGFDHAVRSVIPRAPGLGVGIHLVLTSGRCVADPAKVQLLVDARGMFRHSFLGILRLTTGPTAGRTCDQIERELTAQFERLRRAGVAIDHVNSHQHVHMIPAVWRIVARVAARCGYPVVRLGPPARDRRATRLFWTGRVTGHILKRIVLAACARPTRRFCAEHPAPGAILRHPDGLTAALDRHGMDRHALVRRLTRLPEGITEIVSHPSLASTSTTAALAGSLSREDALFLCAPARRRELEALMDPEVQSVIQQQRITLTSFGTFSRYARTVAV
jgi:predicted glycoside hydrolase/deacetylase ChbG (UPF0249 family)